MKYLKITVVLFALIIGLYACGSRTENPKPSFQSKDTIATTEADVEPEVTAYVVNPDGTMTLAVEMLSTDLKMDCLFAHEVTIRPLENGNFQYVGNRVTYQTEYGLPYTIPRLMWN